MTYQAGDENIYGLRNPNKGIIPGSEVLTESGLNEFYSVPGLEDVDDAFDIFSEQVIDRISEIFLDTGEVPTIIMPLNGGILPTMYVLEAISDEANTDFHMAEIWSQIAEAGPDGQLNNIVFATKAPDGVYTREGEYMLSKPVNPEKKVIVIDDIADELKAYAGVIAAIYGLPSHMPADVFPESGTAQDYSNVELFAVSKKVGTSSAPGYHPDQIKSTVTIPNIVGDGAPWIRAGLGMNSGDAISYELTARQRLARSCYYKGGENQVRAQKFVDQEKELLMLQDLDNLCRLAGDSRFNGYTERREIVNLVDLLTEVEILRSEGAYGRSMQFKLAQEYVSSVLPNLN